MLVWNYNCKSCDAECDENLDSNILKTTPVILFLSAFAALVSMAGTLFQWYYKRE